MIKTPPLVAIFAAMDGSGGAGLLADCRAITAGGCLPLAVATAITAQNLDGVAACWTLPPLQIQQQFTAYPAASLAAVKIGVVGRAATAIAGCLRGSEQPIVWDPVLAPSTGAAFITPVALAGVCRQLLPLATVVTPNRAELLQLAGEKRTAAAIRRLFAAGGRQLLITDIDGHGKNVRHVLLTAAAAKTPLWETTTPRRADTYHGSGCLFSATLAAQLAQGENMPAAAVAAHNTVCQAMEHALAIPALGRQKFLPG